MVDLCSLASSQAEPLLTGNRLMANVSKSAVSVAA